MFDEFFEKVLIAVLGRAIWALIKSLHKKTIVLVGKLKRLFSRR